MTGPDHGTAPRLDAARRLLSDLGWRGETIESAEWWPLRSYLLDFLASEPG